MLKLLIDIGNSRIKWATVNRGKLHPGGSVPRPASDDDLAACVAPLWAEDNKPRAIVVSNVAGPAFATALSKWCENRWQVSPRFITAEQSAHGVINAYKVPERLGPDRWAALIAARKRSKGATCVIDAGTAVTLDVLAADGKHQGGLIIPGLEMMRRALLEHTQAIQPASAEPARGGGALLARDTRDGVDGGTLYALVAVIDRVTADVAAELAGEPTRLLTGGAAATLLPLLAGDYHHVPELVLEGLAIIAEKS